MFAYYLDLALHSLKRNPVLTGLMVLAIALGIGASMTTLTVLHVLSGNPIPGKSSRLYRVQVDPQDMFGWRPGMEPPMQVTWIDGMNLLRAAIAKLKQVDPNGVVTEHDTYDEVRADFFQSERAMAGTLVGVCLALLVVTALGIGGLASFWVGQRRKQIGVRRALGATRADILHYFQTENFLIVTFGVALGMVLAYGLSLLLMQHYELPRLPLFYLPVGAIALWLIGQCAVLGPALRAAAVPPVVATRSV